MATQAAHAADLIIANAKAVLGDPDAGPGLPQHGMREGDGDQHVALLGVEVGELVVVLHDDFGDRVRVHLGFDVFAAGEEAEARGAGCVRVCVCICGRGGGR